MPRKKTRRAPAVGVDAEVAASFMASMRPLIRQVAHEEQAALLTELAGMLMELASKLAPQAAAPVDSAKSLNGATKRDA